MCSCEQPRKLLARQDLRLSLRGACVRNRQRIGFAPEHRAEEELQRAHRLIDRRVGQVLLAYAVQQPRLNLRSIQSIRAATVVARQLDQHRNIGALRALGQAAQHHRVNHLLT